MGIADSIKKHPLFQPPAKSNKEEETPVKVVTLTQEATRDPAMTAVKRVGLSSDPTNRDFTGPEDDLTQVDTAWKTESYVRRAVDKFTELMFKSGWELRGKNVNAVKYVRQRLAFIAECTSIPTDILWLEIGEDIVKYNNAVIVKSRDAVTQLKGLKVQGIAGKDPVAGYFPLNVTTMTQKRDKNGTVKSWQQDTGDSPKKFKPEDIVFYYYKKEKGKAFATPYLYPVLDDIRALRQAEENILRLIYRNLFPFLHHQIGSTGADGIPGMPEEVADAKKEIENMDLEGGLVTTERHTITPIATDEIIDAYNYLLYFERRVFTGIGMSEAQMGRGSTSSRSTAENMSDQVIDTVKAFQRVMEVFTNAFIIKELLMEGGFDPILNEDDTVEFRFKEIDLDAKIKMENHAIFQYEHNAITEDEMRQLLGRDPVTDRGLMFVNTVTIPAAEAQAKAKAQAMGTTAGGSSSGPSKGSSGSSGPSSVKKSPSAPAKTTPKASPRPSNKKVAASVDQDIVFFALQNEFDGLRKDLLKLTQLYYAGEEPHKVLAELAAVLKASQKEIEITTHNIMGREASLRTRDYFNYLYKQLGQQVAESLELASPVNNLMNISSYMDMLESQLESIIEYIAPYSVNCDIGTIDLDSLAEEVIEFGEDS